MFKWEDLDAVQLRSLMRLEEGENQLYISVMLNELRNYQREEKIPSFNTFWSGLKDAVGFSSSQQSPLDQRVDILREFVYDSDKNVQLRQYY